MSKSVLLSVQPYWVFLIIARAMGWNYPKEKTVEVRKTFPKDKDWNRVVEIYCTKDKASFNQIPKEYQPLMKELLGKVVGEFVCNSIECFTTDYRQNVKQTKRISIQSCVDIISLAEYENNVPCLYGWHISELKIHDKPIQLNEFYKSCGTQNCNDCQFWFCNGEYAACETRPMRQMKRPPQSWCYVEEA